MRDLYSRLNIAKSASKQDLRNAISECKNAAVKKDASQVLLVESRRRIYDRIHSTLDDIGTLRAGLGLNHGDNWRSPESDDFTKVSTQPFSMHDTLMQKLRQFNRRAKTHFAINSTKEFAFGAFRLAAVVAVFSAFIWVISIWEESDSRSSDQNSGYSAPKDPSFNEPALPLPSSGTVRRYTTSRGVAPLEIKTSTGANYLVKLEDVSTGENTMDVFIRGGSTIELEIPLGTYRLKYASGKKWYGYEHYFGPNTGYNKADSTFRFYDDGYRVSGYTVTLFQVRDGNLSTSRLPPSQF